MSRLPFQDGTGLGVEACGSAIGTAAGQIELCQFA